MGASVCRQAFFRMPVHACWRLVAGPCTEKEASQARDGLAPPTKPRRLKDGLYCDGHAVRLVVNVVMCFNTFTCDLEDLTGEVASTCS